LSEYEEEEILKEFELLSDVQNECEYENRDLGILIVSPLLMLNINNKK
jgi:hypothetical protein